MKLPLNQIICGDFLEVTRDWSDGCVDAVVTDPPYNVGLDYSDGDNRPDYANWCKAWFRELQRISRGPIAISCGVNNLLLWQGIEQPTWVIAWLKLNSMKRVGVGWNTWEPVLLYGKTLGKKTHDSFTVNIVPQKNTGSHPCPKPMGWARELIERLTKPGMSVLDPFCGSGTTCIAAKLLDRKFIGIDRSRKYVKIARRRLDRIEFGDGIGLFS